MKKELNITAMKEGTVIDHIPARTVFKVLRILNPQEHSNMLVVATNLKSKSLGKKGIIKIEGRFLTQDEVNKIALLASKATVNIIKDYEVSQKINIKIPNEFLGIINCSNPKCITNDEAVKTHFHVKQEDPLRVICHHCERIMKEEEIKIL